MKKIILFILSVMMILNPVTVTGQIRNIDDGNVDEFSEEVSESWREARTIWGQVYTVTRSFWNQHIGWRVAPIWNTVKSWIDSQVVILRDSFRKDVEKAGEVIKEEAEQKGEAVSKSIWQMILEAAGINKEE